MYPRSNDSRYRSPLAKQTGSSGVPSTDSPAPALFDLLTNRASRDWANFKDVGDGLGLIALDSLRHTAPLSEGAL